MADVFVTRPRGPRWVAIGLSAVLTVGAFVGYWTLPENTRSHFTAFQIVTLLVFVLVMDVFMLVLGFAYVRADAEGLRFRNGLRTHQLPWEAVDSISFGPGMPWPYVELNTEFATEHSDRMMLMAIHGSDGKHAARQVEQLRDVVARWKQRPDGGRRAPVLVTGAAAGS